MKKCFQVSLRIMTQKDAQDDDGDEDDEDAMKGMERYFGLELMDEMPFVVFPIQLLLNVSPWLDDFGTKF